MVDYYSRYIDVAYLPSLTSFTVIGKLKGFFAHHGIPDIVMAPSFHRQSSAHLLNIGTFSTSPAALTTPKAMVLRKER